MNVLFSFILGLHVVASMTNFSENLSIPFNVSFNESLSEDLLIADSLVFFLIGDWGKGGVSGTYGTSIDVNGSNLEDDDHRQRRNLDGEEVSHEQNNREKDQKQNDNHDREKENNNREKDQKQNDNHDREKENNNHSNKKKRQKQINQVAVATSMGERAKELHPNFIVALGDNFYNDGVSSRNDSLWTYLWKDVYLQNNSYLNVPWYTVFGNHDYGYGQQGVQAQIDRYRYHEDDDIWICPSTNFTETFKIPGGGSVVIVFVDTVTLAPSQNKCSNSEGGVSEETQQYLIQNQQKNLEKILIDATADNPDWLLMAGHYPIYSAGEHGDISELLQNLLPLIVKYKVDAYFAGHDHISEHLIANSTHFFVAGAGSMTDSLGGNSSANLLWSGTGYSAFTSVNADQDVLTISYIDVNNTVRYKYSIHKSFVADGDDIYGNFSIDNCTNITLCNSSVKSSGSTSIMDSSMFLPLVVNSFNNLRFSTLLISTILVFITAILVLIVRGYYRNDFDEQVKAMDVEETPGGMVNKISDYEDDMVENYQDKSRTTFSSYKKINQNLDVRENKFSFSFHSIRSYLTSNSKKQSYHKKIRPHKSGSMSDIPLKAAESDTNIQFENDQFHIRPTFNSPSKTSHQNYHESPWSPVNTEQPLDEVCLLI